MPDLEPVPFSDDELPIVAEEAPPTAGATETEEERAQRADRRRERAAQKERERKQLEDELKAEREQRQAMAERLARLEGTFNATMHQRQQPAADPYKARLDAIYEEQRNAYTAAQAEVANKTYTKEREAHYEALSRRLEEQKAQVFTERALAQAEAVQRQAAGQQVWAQQYPEIYSNPRAYQFAKATYERRLALDGKDSPDMIREVMEETRTALKIGPKPAPTATEKERMTGIASSGGSNGTPPKNGIVPTRELRMMAEALYPDMDPDKAFKKWVDGPGKALRQQKVL